MDADKVSFLAGNELPDAALVKTLLVANGEQGVPAKLKEKGGTIAHTCTYISNLHSTCICIYNCVATNDHNHPSGWDEVRPVLTPLMRCDKDGNIISTCYTLQVTHTL